MSPNEGTDLFDRMPVIDVDTHLTEPPDVWTARMPASRHDDVPHIERIDGVDTWMAAGERLGAPGYYSMAGHNGVMPASIPKTYAEIDPAMYDAKARLAFLDAEGIDAQVLYPNVGGFGNGYFLRLGDRELVVQCVRAYNDFLTDWCSADPDRLIAITALPFWDIDLAIDELQRCVANGHRAINFCNQPQDYGQPPLAHPHWDPIWAAAQEAGVPVNFHVGGGSMGTQFVDTAEHGLDDQLRQGVVAHLHGQHALHRRPHLRRRLPPLPGPRVRLGRVRGRLAARSAGDVRLAVA